MRTFNPDDIETQPMAGWMDVYHSGEYIGYVYAQNLPFTRYMARDVNGDLIAEGDYASMGEAVTAVALSI